MKFWLMREEKQILFRKWVRKPPYGLGMNSDTAKLKIKKESERLHKLVMSLKERKLSDKKINKRFQQEFEKLCQQQ